MPQEWSENQIRKCYLTEVSNQMDLPAEKREPGYFLWGENIFIFCPGCKELMSLEDHGIAINGRVAPSLVCAYDCGFHDFAVLVDYTHGARNGRLAQGRQGLGVILREDLVAFFSQDSVEIVHPSEIRGDGRPTEDEARNYWFSKLRSLR